MSGNCQWRSVAKYPGAIPSEESHQIVSIDDRIWLFSKKFADQPSYHYGHYVLLAGGHSAAFNTSTDEWEDSAPQKLAPIKEPEEENTAEILFSFDHKLYLLLFKPFGAFKVTELYAFNSESQQWGLHSNVKTQPSDELKTDVEKKYKQELVPVKGSPTQGVYFVSFVDHRIRLHLLRMPSARWELVAEVPDEANPMRIQPTMAAKSNSFIYVQGGVHGCGFRWQPQGMVRINTLDGTSQWVEIAPDTDGHRPSWSFSGSLEQAVIFTPPSQTPTWVHLAGHNSTGLTGSVFNGEVWSVTDWDSSTPKWMKSTTMEMIPDGGHDTAVLHVPSSDSDALYCVSKAKGVMKCKPSVA